MKTIFAVFITVVTVMALILKKEYRMRILMAYAGVLILFSYVYDCLLIGNIVPFYRPVSQTFYQKEFLSEGQYPDSLLPLILKGRTVYVKNDPYTIDEAKAEGKDYLYAYYHGTNLKNYAAFAGAEVVEDETMNETMVNDSLLKEDFERFGSANDMFRYSFMMNDFWEELGNYFTYQWYYYDHLGEISVFVNPSEDGKGEDIADADELVILWDSSHEKEEENIYIMTKAYYEDSVRNAAFD
ncbi:MAG: hypothetical protein K6G22_12320 [Lachnospiraceae bacterium]|nr:hypothetical protein [Lachnospiraceae bacterium]